MMCEDCGLHVANVHCTQITDKETVVLHLCQECAHKKGIHVSIEDSQTGDEKAAAVQKEVICPACRMKLSRFQKSGRLGCDTCYSAFEKEVNDLLLQLHGSCSHKGKLYGRTVQHATASVDVARLRDELHNAIRSEEFERAASIRDKINSLEIKKLL
jgi:protein arginine kinase activator